MSNRVVKVLSTPVSHIYLVDAREVAAHLRVAESDTNYLNIIIANAQAVFTAQTNRVIGTFTYQYTLSGNKRTEIRLPYPPVHSITSVVNGNNNPVAYTLVNDNCLQTTNLHETLKIVFEAGYTLENVPLGVKMAILQYIALLYTHRGDTAVEAEVYQSYLNAIAPYKIYNFWS